MNYSKAWFCAKVVQTNKLELLKYIREVKKCGWDEETIKMAARIGNLEILILILILILARATLHPRIANLLVMGSRCRGGIVNI